jgi:hypothetical protein
MQAVRLYVHDYPKTISNSLFAQTRASSVPRRVFHDFDIQS